MPLIWVSMPEIHAYMPRNQDQGVWYYRQMPETRIRLFVIKDSMPQTRTAGLQSRSRCLNTRQICTQNMTNMTENQARHANNLVQYE